MKDRDAIYESSKEVASCLAQGTISRGVDRPGLVRLAVRNTKQCDRLISETTVQGNTPLACREGCDACCRNMPFGTVPEILAIADRCLSMPEQDLKALVAKLHTYVSSAEPHRPEGFLRFKDPCPFLKDSRCQIYEDRPLFCRGLTSENPDLCRMLNERPFSEEVFGPNGELATAQGFIDGTTQTLAKAGLSQRRLEVPRMVLELLTNSAAENELLTSPRPMAISAQRPWVVRLGEDPQISLPATTKDSMTFMEERRHHPLEQLTHLIQTPTTANLIARMWLPSAPRSVEEEKAWWDVMNNALDEALEFEQFDAWEAYAVIEQLRPISFGYQSRPLKEIMAKVGRLLNDKVASKVCPELLEAMPVRKPGKLRVGILGDASNSSGSAWTLGWAEKYDRQDLELHIIKAYKTEDRVSMTFRGYVDHYHYLQGGGIEGAKYIRNLDLDYLIFTDVGDFGGYYRYAMYRLARRQATAWGCPFTSGLVTMDDYLTGDLMEILSADEHYTENLVRLANTGLTLADSREPHLQGSRARFGLPEGWLVAYPQYIMKWFPEHDELLAELSAKLENPIYIADIGTDYEKAKFTDRMAKVGAKIAWFPVTRGKAVFRALLKQFDVCIDSPGWSGGITGLDALGSGTPVVTMPGTYLRQRLVSGFCKQAGVPDCCVSNAAEYIALATDRDAVAEIKSKIEADSLFNDLQPLRDLEDHIRGTALI